MNPLITQLTALFGQVLGGPEAQALAERLGAFGAGPGMLILLGELQDNSRKAAAAAMASLPIIMDLLTDREMISWVDLAVALSERSGATGLKYCKESVEILRAVPPQGRGAALTMALELADQDAPMALEALRQSAGVVPLVGAEALATWAQVGSDLARWDDVLGVEYFRRGPEILHVLQVDDLKGWAGLGPKLVTPNSFGKPDYFAALTFFRTSPALLGDLPTPSIRRRALALAGLLADQLPEAAVEFLGNAPAWLRRVESQPWQERVLQYAMLLAEKDAATMLAYFRRVPEVVALIGAEEGGSVDRFEDWYKGGMEVLAYNPEAARAYFAVETRKALEAVDRAARGVALREISRILKLFAEGLSGRAISIRALDEDRGKSHSQISSGVGLISLPSRLRQFATREENFRLYKIITAHEAGHLQYGTYDLDLGRLADIAAQACVRYGRPELARPSSLEQLFQCYPHHLLIRDLWVLTEDARVEANLKAEYPGLRRDIEAVVREELPHRSLQHGMTVREMIVELLLQLSVGGGREIAVPFALEEVVGRAWALLQTVVQPGATAEEVIRIVHRVYVLIEELTATTSADDISQAPDQQPDLTEKPRGGESQGGAYRPAANFSYRGSMDAERIRTRRDDGPAESLDQAGTNEMAEAAEAVPGESSRENARPVQHGASAPPGQNAPLEDMLTDRSGPSSGQALSAGTEQQGFLYDEWDGTIQDYRSQWCRVVEQIGVEGSETFVEEIRRAHGSAIRLLRRYFEGLRPPGLRRVRRQADGEEVDIEAAVEAMVERQAQASPTEFVYIRRDRRQRDVAASFLVDLSGSTGRQIGLEGKRIIDVEKEGLVLLAEALEAIGDQYAVYGYSGQSRREVQFLVLKDFDERYGPQVWRRIDGVQPLTQNRDGAAIRHAVHRLADRAARVKLLILLSDGRPLDDLYTDEYALEDTRAALREAKGQGVHVFCITVDQEASGYLARMYGDVCYLIVDRVETLPERLPRIYRTLTAV